MDDQTASEIRAAVERIVDELTATDRPLPTRALLERVTADEGVGATAFHAALIGLQDDGVVTRAPLDEVRWRLARGEGAS